MNKPIVYIDMDGVLANLYEYVEDYYGCSYKDLTLADYEDLSDNYDLFENVPKTKIADTLITKVVQLFGSYSILSSPLPGRELDNEISKRIWIRENLLIQPEYIVISSNKFEYAWDNNGWNILIDDYRPNITSWEQNGGIGIKCKHNSKKHDLKYALSQLDRIYGELQG